MKRFERMFYVLLTIAFVGFMIQFHPDLFGKILIGIVVAVFILLSCWAV